MSELTDHITFKVGVAMMLIGLILLFIKGWLGLLFIIAGIIVSTYVLWYAMLMQLRGRRSADAVVINDGIGSTNNNFAYSGQGSPAGGKGNNYMGQMSTDV